MLAAGIKSPVPLEELENHLRDEIEQQIKIGLTAPTAFGIAAENIGSGLRLQSEFEKNQTDMKTRRWKFIEIFLGLNTLCLPLAAAAQAFVF